ncbi:MAG: hypothetical protein P1U58_14280 [Verrucomicrobiales bacterium]|nr:hypothetical protein [Verrucomicrobiales bacterium]
MRGIPKERPIDFFYPKLADLQEEDAALRKRFGGKTCEVLALMKGRTEFPEDYVEAHYLMEDLVRDSARDVIGMWVEGSEAGEYQVEVREFGGVYFVSAPQFDDIGYFETEEDAETAMRNNWF